MGDLGIGEILTLVLGAAGVGTTIAGLAGVGQPSIPKPAATPTTPTGPSAADRNRIMALVSQAFSNIQDRTSGLASQDYLSQVAPLEAGTVGIPGSSGAVQQALNQYLGLSGGGLTTGSPLG